jgi:hypothetical protein
MEIAAFTYAGCLVSTASLEAVEYEGHTGWRIGDSLVLDDPTGEYENETLADALLRLTDALDAEMVVNDEGKTTGCVVGRCLSIAVGSGEGDNVITGNVWPGDLADLMFEICQWKNELKRAGVECQTGLIAVMSVTI